MNKHHIFNKVVVGAALLLTLGVSSCKDSFLEQEPQTKATLSDYFSTEEHITEALNTCYTFIRAYDYFVASDNSGMYSPFIFADVMGDDMLVGASDPSDQEVWHLASDYQSTAVNTVWAIWDNGYNGVRAANEAIDYAQQAAEAQKVSTAFARRVEAEARVMRAFYYMLTWKFYGNIVYFDRVLGATERADQLSANEVYEKLVEDLEGAIALDALPMVQDEENLGRATQALAYMIYAELVMYQNDETRFGKALGYMKEIDTCGKYDLDPDYAHIWTPDGEWSQESIFEVNYIDGSSSGRSYPDANDPYKMGAYQMGGTILPRVISPDGGSASDGVQNGWGTFVPRRTTYELFDAADKRRDATFFIPSDSYKARYQDQGMFLGKYVARDSHTSAGTGGASDMVFNDNLRVYRFAETLLNAAELTLRTGGSAADAKEYLKRVRQRAGLSEVEATIDNIIQERRFEFVGEGKRYWDLVRMEGVSGATVKASTVLKKDAEAINEKGDPGRQQDWKPTKKYLPISFKEISAAEGALQQNDEYFN